jgi:hypothetical protein
VSVSLVDDRRHVAAALRNRRYERIDVARWQRVIAISAHDE